MHPLESLLERFAAVARPEIRRDHLPNSCIASTWITIEVMRQLGVAARALEVRLSVGNAAYRRLRDLFGPPKTPTLLKQWAAEHGAYVVGVGFDDGSVGIGGHLVALVAEGFLVDASIDQTVDPPHGLNPPPVPWGVADPLFLSGARPLQRLDVGNLFVEYSQHPVASRYLDSYDWRHNQETDAARCPGSSRPWRADAWSRYPRTGCERGPRKPPIHPDS